MSSTIDNSTNTQDIINNDNTSNIVDNEKTNKKHITLSLYDGHISFSLSNNSFNITTIHDNFTINSTFEDNITTTNINLQNIQSTDKHYKDDKQKAMNEHQFYIIVMQVIIRWFQYDIILMGLILLSVIILYRMIPIIKTFCFASLISLFFTTIVMIILFFTMNNTLPVYITAM